MKRFQVSVKQERAAFKQQLTDVGLGIKLELCYCSAAHRQSRVLETQNINGACM